MTQLRKASKELSEKLRALYSNIQAVGTCQRNSEAYQMNPKAFASEVKEDALIVFTTTDPSDKQLQLTFFGGFPVTWKKTGIFTAKGATND